VTANPNRPERLCEIAVGSRVTSRPPHRTVRAQFGHMAPPLGCLTAKRARFFYFGVGAELEGGLTAGPLLLPGNPGTLAAS
jgi:hypothetical protein